MKSNPAPGEPSVFTDRRFTCFSDYARFILEHKHQEYVNLVIDYSYEVNVPMLRHFAQLDRQQLVAMGLQSSGELLRAIADNTVGEYIARSRNNWLSNQLSVVSREQILAEDVTLISFVRRRAFRTLLPGYTTDMQLHIDVMDEVDRFTVISDSLFLNTLIQIQQEQINKSKTELEKREQQLLEAQTIGNIGSFEWDLPGNQATYSPQAFSIFEIEPRPSYEVDALFDLIHKDDREKLSHAIRESLRSGQFTCEYRVQTSRAEKYILSKGRIIYDQTIPVKMVGTLMDITEKQAIIKRLQEIELQNKQAEAITHMGNWAWIPSTDEIIWSDELYRIHGLEPQSQRINTETIYEFMLPGDQSVFKTEWQNHLGAGHVPDQTYRIRRRDGSIRVLKSKGEIIRNSEGKLEKVVGTIQDITAEFTLTEQLKEREQFLQQLNESLANTNDELLRKNKELESFNFISSHDLQEPLRKIQVFTDRIITDNPDNLSGTTLNNVARIRTAAQRMQKLIEDFLEFSQTISPTRHFENVNLNEVIDEARNDLQTRIQDKHAEIQYANLPTIPAIRYQMKQLFANLISNSLKYSQPQEKPVIRIEATSDEHEGKSYYTLAFRDNGIGFEQKYSTKVFELFQRLHNKNEYSGTGIGLALCKRICENHHGTMSVKSEPMKGTTFYVRLPV